MKLQGKEYIPCFSYEPMKVRLMDHAGAEIVDIVTAKRSDMDLTKWARWFRKLKEPCFATIHTGKENGVVKLFIRRSVDCNGVAL